MEEGEVVEVMVVVQGEGWGTERARSQERAGS